MARTIARPLSYKELLGVWPGHLAGLVFLRTLEPVTLEPVRRVAR